MLRAPHRAAVVLAALLATACQPLTGGTGEGRRAGGAESRPTTPCDGRPGMPPRSDSYRPGAADVAADGAGLVLDITVTAPAPEGGCVIVPGALVEIWHSGDTGQYRPDLWRTARRTDDQGRVSYTTARPVAKGESPAHVHVRVSTLDAGPFDWFVGVDPATPARLELRLELREAPERNPTPTTIVDPDRDGRTGV